MNHRTLQQAAANAFVLERTSQIEKFISRFRKWLDADEYRQEVYFQIIRRHHTLRLRDARDREMVISTWLGWQCRAAAKTVRRRSEKHRQGRVGDSEGVLLRIATTSEQMGDPDRMDFSQEIRDVLKFANHEERVAVSCMLNEWNKTEMKEHLGLSIQDRDRALRSLATKIQEIKNVEAVA